MTATQAQLAAGFTAARAWIDKAAGWYASDIPDSDVKLIVGDIVAAARPDAAFTAARARINALAGWYASMIPDSDVRQLCQVVLGAAKPTITPQPQENESGN